MLSKNQIKLINQLKLKKNRASNNLFVAEGIKTVNELLKSNFKEKYLFATLEYQNIYNVQSLQIITQDELNKISAFKSPNQTIGVFEIPKTDAIKSEGFSLVLDDINDPGNLGTIIRLCDWFGVDQLVCSLKTVDCYNLKTIQASMGSIARVSIVYTDIELFLKNEDRTIYGTFLEGDNIYKTDPVKSAVLVMGNEANGISSTIEKRINKKVTIPQFGEIQETESLNVAMATAIFLSEFKRNQL